MEITAEKIKEMKKLIKKKNLENLKLYDADAYDCFIQILNILNFLDYHC